MLAPHPATLLWRAKVHLYWALAGFGRTAKKNIPYWSYQLISILPIISHSTIIWSGKWVLAEDGGHLIGRADPSLSCLWPRWLVPGNLGAKCKSHFEWKWSILYFLGADLLSPSGHTFTKCTNLAFQRLFIIFLFSLHFLVLSLSRSHSLSL